MPLRYIAELSLPRQALTKLMPLWYIAELRLPRQAQTKLMPLGYIAELSLPRQAQTKLMPLGYKAELSLPRQAQTKLMPLWYKRGRTMKKPIVITSQLCLILAFVVFYPVGVSSDQLPKPTVESTQKVIASESDKALHLIIEDMFDVFFRPRREKIYVKPVEIKFWLQKLDEYKKKNPQDIDRVLFLEAECLYRMRDIKAAYSKYYQLKIGMDRSNDHLTDFVDARLSELSSNIKPTSLVLKQLPEYIYFEHFLMTGTLLFIILIYLIDRSVRRRSEIEDETYDKCIVPKNKVINLKEMCAQDGRCSEDAVREYCQLIKDNKWESIAEQKRENLKFARLMAEGHKTIIEINNKAPYPIKLISNIPIIGGLPLFWRYSVSGALFVGLWWFTGYVTGLSVISDPVTYFLLAAFVISSLYGIHLMAAKTVDSIDEFICMLEPEQELGSIKILQVWIERLFNNVRQLYFPAVILAITIYMQYKTGMLTIDGKLNIDIFYSAVLIFLTASLIWFLFGSLILMKNIFNLKDLSINPLSPSKTIGLEKWISVIGTYNMVCSIVLTLGCSIPVYFSFVKEGDPVSGTFWFYLIAPILIFAWIYPYIKIGSLVKTKKMKRMNFIKTKLSILYNEWVESETKILKHTEKLDGKDEHDPTTCDSDPVKEKEKIKLKLEEMENYYKVFQLIEKSPESYFDLNSALELAKVLGFPSLFALVSAMLSYALK